jgi:hypothetical protein
MVGGLLGTLTAAIDELADIDLDTVSDAELHDAVVGLGALSSRLEAQWCRLIAPWDHRQIWADNGSKAAAARLARETHRRRRECDRLVHRAGDLATMPRTAAAYQAGETYGGHVDLVASCDRQWRNADFAESEELLVNLCRTPFFGVAARGIDYWKQCADRVAADALVEMAMRSATAPADGLRPRPLLSVTIGIDPFNHLCQTAAGAVIAPGLLVPHLSDADIERIVYDPPARRFEASRKRSFTGAMRRIIEIRDGHCQHPSGCDEPAARCDIDHIVAHSHGGITCLCQGELECRYHNRIHKAATDKAAHGHRAPTEGKHPCPYPTHHTADDLPATGTDTRNATDPSRAPPETG